MHLKAQPSVPEEQQSQGPGGRSSWPLSYFTQLKAFPFPSLDLSFPTIVYKAVMISTPHAHHALTHSYNHASLLFPKAHIHTDLRAFAQLFPLPGTHFPSYSCCWLCHLGFNSNVAFPDYLT